MTMMTQADPQSIKSNMPSVPLRGSQNVKKEPPKIIEKLIDKVEALLTQPHQAQSKPQTKNEPKGIDLPKGTTITFPDGKAFETQTESTIRKGGE